MNGWRKLRVKDENGNLLELEKTQMVVRTHAVQWNDSFSFDHRFHFSILDSTDSLITRRVAVTSGHSASGNPQHFAGPSFSVNACSTSGSGTRVRRVVREKKEFTLVAAEDEADTTR